MNAHRRTVAVIGALGLTITIGAARADDQSPAAVEHLLGATDVNAAIGNGQLTAGVSAQGELTVLRWPSPSYFEHVDFKTSTADDARARPHFGAADNQGSFAGVLVDDGSGKPVFAWARDAGWTSTQRYAADDSNQLITTMHNATLKVTVTITDAVPADLDVLVRHIAVTPDSGFTPAALRLVYFENFAPTLEKLDFYPTDQTNLLESRDYALGMSAKDNALVHFSVTGRPSALVAPLAQGKTAADVDAFLDGSIRGKAGAEGTFILLGGDRAPDGFQCGFDQPPAAGMNVPSDAYDDATATLGALSGSPAVLAHADGALAWKLPSAGGAVDVVIASAANLADAEKQLATARTRGGDALRSADLAFWKSWLAPAKLPDTTDADRLRLAKRALLAIAVGRDRNTGAVVASIASQPPYDLDWPRDGAFIDYALDLAGYHDWVTQHRMFYAQWQRLNDGDFSSGGDAPPGSWAMNYYADGHPGGPIPFEIDEVAFTLWMHVEHAAFLDASARAGYLGGVYASIKLAADLLTSCVDAPTGLQCKANEDDNLAPSISLHGAGTVRMGLDAAIRAANLLDKGDDARRWRARLDVLDAAIDKAFGDPMLGYAGHADTGLGRPPGGDTGPVAWVLWPEELRPASDPRMKLCAAQIVAGYHPFFDGTTIGGSYFGKGLVGLARWAAVAGDTTTTTQESAWLDVMVKQVATPGTGHYGESFEYASGTFTNVTAIPHLWEGTLTYLALMATYSPDSFAPAAIASDVAPPVPPPSGCGCRAAGDTTGGASRIALGAGLMLLGIVLRVRAARRRGRRRPGR